MAQITNGSITVYTEKNFKGDSLTLTTKDVDSAITQFLSIKVYPSTRAIFYTAPNFGGQSLMISNTSSDQIKKYPFILWNKPILSIRIYRIEASKIGYFE